MKLSIGSFALILAQLFFSYTLAVYTNMVGNSTASFPLYNM